MHVGDLLHLVAGGVPDLFLGVVAEARGPLVMLEQIVAALLEPNGIGVREQVQGLLQPHAQRAQPLNVGPHARHLGVKQVERLRGGREQRGHHDVRRGPPREGRGERGPRAGRHAVALVLAVRGVAQPLLEGVVRVVERSRHCVQGPQAERLGEQRVARGIAHPGHGGVIVELARQQAERGAHSVRDGALSVDLPVDEQAGATAERGVERGVESGGVARGRRALLRRGRGVGRQHRLDVPKEQRVVRPHGVDHGLHEQARLRGHVPRGAHAVVAVERDAVDRVVQVRVCGDGQGVPSDLLRLLLDGTPPRVGVLAPRGEHREEGLGRRAHQGVRERAVAGVHALDTGVVDRLRRGGERWPRDQPGLDLDVALADLLGVVEGVGVQERPERLAAHGLERELERRVLERGVVARLICAARDAVPQGDGGVVPRDILGRDDARAVASAGGRYGVVERPGKGVDERDLGRRRGEGF